MGMQLSLGVVLGKLECCGLPQQRCFYTGMHNFAAGTPSGLHASPYGTSEVTSGAVVLFRRVRLLGCGASQRCLDVYPGGTHINLLLNAVLW